MDEPVGPGDPDEGDDAVAPPLNHPPSAVTRAVETTEGGSFVELDGSESDDADGDVLTFRWAQTGGADLELLDADRAIAGFVVPASSPPWRY